MSSEGIVPFGHGAAQAFALLDRITSRAWTEIP